MKFRYNLLFPVLVGLSIGAITALATTSLKVERLEERSTLQKEVLEDIKQDIKAIREDIRVLLKK
jgi:hypothetical protein